MPVEKYFDEVKRILKYFSSFILSASITFESRSSGFGKVKGYIIFIDSSRLHLLEIIDATQPGKIQYSYHYQTKDGKIIFRYDNAPHHKEIKSFPHHRHCESEQQVLATDEPSLNTVLKEIVAFFLKNSQIA